MRRQMLSEGDYRNRQYYPRSLPQLTAPYRWQWHCQVKRGLMQSNCCWHHNSLMRTSVSPYRRHRFPAEIISHPVWLYFRFSLSFRDVEEMLAMRGVSLSYQTVREWCLRFGQTYANGLRRRFLDPVTNGTSMKCSSRSTDAICRVGRGDFRRADHELMIAKRQFILPESLRLFLLALS
jgi:hypothetical protein